MSGNQQATVAMEKIKHYLTVIILTLLIPLILSFVIWIVGSAFASGGGVAHGITYGIYAINGTKYTGSSGIVYLWINSRANGGIASSPAFPAVMLTILNELITFAAVILAIITGLDLIGALNTYISATRY